MVSLTTVGGRHILGAETDIQIIAIDEINARAPINRIISDMRANNNFDPCSLNIAKPLREAGIPVIIGGFHVSGMLAMFDKIA